MAHLSCVGSTREELGEILDGMAARGSRTCSRCAATRRAARPSGRPHPGGLHYSTELAALIAERLPVRIGAACFPEVHPEAPDLAHDLRFLREKVAERRRRS